MIIELVNTTETLLDTIKKAKNRLEVSVVYKWAICSSEETDWKKVNQAIINRWSINALDYIKKMAWR